MHRFAMMILCYSFGLVYGADLNSQRYFKEYEKYSLAPQNLKQLKHAFMVEQLLKIAESNPSIRVQLLGTSVEQRNIYSISFGRGTTRILLWSQMHGDECTATAALLAVFNYLAHNPGDQLVQSISGNLTIYAIPMLNPDGAENNQRYNAQDIDINRDARILATSEGRILKRMQEQLRPDYGFNLHDMMGREMVDENKKALYLAFMAPPFNKEDEDNAIRLRAKKLIVYLQNILHPFIDEHIARYKADYMPRAFGDAMQNWGVSTVLIESGLNDTADPHFLVKLNFLTLLNAFDAIATGRIEQTDPDLYEQIPLEGLPLFDLVIRDALIYNGTAIPAFRADIGINIENKTVDGKEIRQGLIVDIGDLSLTSGIKIIAGENLVVTPGRIVKLRAVVDKSVLIKNGVTTAIIKAEENGPDYGDFYFPVKDYPDSMVLDLPDDKLMAANHIPSYTSVPVTALGLKELGQIKRERQADLLIFDGVKENQLDLSRVIYVLKNGLVIKVGE